MTEELSSSGWPDGRIGKGCKPLSAVTAWSYSRLNMWERCPAAFHYKHVLKLPEEQSSAMARGSRIDKIAEDYITGAGTDAMPAELAKFDSLFREMRALPSDLKVVQQNWGYDAQWRATGWFAKDTWLRVKLDAGVIYPDGDADVVDVKTGKQYDSNKEQLSLYALATFRRYPHVSHVTTRLWYLDSGAEVTAEFEADSATDEIAKWEARVAPMFADTVYAPRPNDGCRGCAFSKSKKGPCRYG